MQTKKYKKVGELLSECNIQFSTLYNFLAAQYKKKAIELSHNTWLDEKTVNLCRQEFMRDSISKKKSQQVKLEKIGLNNQAKKIDTNEGKRKKRELDRYRKIIKHTRKKKAAIKAKGNSKTNKPTGYIKIVGGGLCNPR